MKYLTLLLLTISLTAKAQERYETLTIVNTSGESYNCRIWKSKEAIVEYYTDGKRFQPVRFILTKDTLRMALDSMFLDLIKGAKVIEVGGLRFWREIRPTSRTLDKPDYPEYIIIRTP